MHAARLIDHNGIGSPPPASVRPAAAAPAADKTRRSSRAESRESPRSRSCRSGKCIRDGIDHCRTQTERAPGRPKIIIFQQGKNLDFLSSESSILCLNAHTPHPKAHTDSCEIHPFVAQIHQVFSSKNGSSKTAPVKTAQSLTCFHQRRTRASIQAAGRPVPANSILHFQHQKSSFFNMIKS